jgi:uncharacterized protein YdhG (YjbR/CyaY superfamily)
MKNNLIKNVDEYITKCPKEVQGKLIEVRAAIREVAPESIEAMSYFQIPGYSYKGYDYNGMFVWFSYKKPYLRLHVRPPVLQDYKNLQVMLQQRPSLASRQTKRYQ